MNQTQIRALDALLTSRNLSEAAEKAGISRKTLYQYIHNDIEFSDAYNALMNEQIIAHFEAMQEKRDKALSVLVCVLENDKEKSANRLKAAQIILSSANKAAELAKESLYETSKANEEAEHASFKADLLMDLYGPISPEEIETAKSRLFPKSNTF